MLLLFMTVLLKVIISKHLWTRYGGVTNQYNMLILDINCKCIYKVNYKVYVKFISLCVRLDATS